MTEFVKHTHTENGHELNAWVVNEPPENASELQVAGVGPVLPRKGIVFMETQRPGVYDMMTTQQWEESGYASAETAPVAPVEEVDDHG